MGIPHREIRKAWCEKTLGTTKDLELFAEEGIFRYIRILFQESNYKINYS